MRFRIAAVVLAACATSWARADVSADVAAYASMPQFSDIEISPDGKKIAALVTIKGKRVIYTLEIGSGEPQLMAADETWHLTWIDWVDNRFVLVGIKAPYRRGGVATVETRLVSFDSETGDGKLMFRRYMSSISRKGGVVPQIQDDVLQMLPGRAEEFLITYDRDGSGADPVYFANARTGNLGKKVQRSDPYVTRWRADAAGNIRVGFGYARDRTSFNYKIKGADGKWFDHSERFNAGGFRVVALPVDGTGHVLVLADHEYPLGALYRFDPAEDAFVDMVAQHDESEVSGLRTNSLAK